MKKIPFLILLFFIVIFSNVSKSEEIYSNTTEPLKTSPSDTLLIFFSTIDLHYYYGKPVDSFILVIPKVADSIKILPQTKIQYASYLQLEFDSSFFVRIYVKDFQQMNPFSTTGNWNVNLFRMENVYRISIYRNQDCYRGWCKDHD